MRKKWGERDAYFLPLLLHHTSSVQHSIQTFPCHLNWQSLVQLQVQTKFNPWMGFVTSQSEITGSYNTNAGIWIASATPYWTLVRLSHPFFSWRLRDWWSTTYEHLKFNVGEGGINGTYYLMLWEVVQCDQAKSFWIPLKANLQNHPIICYCDGSKCTHTYIVTVLTTGKNSLCKKYLKDKINKYNELNQV